MITKISIENYKSITKLDFSPGRFILNEKMARAVALLSGTDLPIDTVAKQCGFRDRPTFTRFMKRAKGMSPSEFREKYLMKTSE